MSIGTDLIAALRSFAAIEREIVAAGNMATADNALAFVRMRRGLVMAFASLGIALEKDAYLAANPALKTQAMRLFSAFRAQNSINQADWPAVRVKDDPALYREACRPVGVSSLAFWSWIERETGFKA